MEDITSTGQPGGTTPVGGGISTPAAGTPAPGAATSGHVDINDDTLVRIPGQDQPVKYGELYKRLQADHTKKSTAVAKAEAALKAQQSQWSTKREQEETYLKQLAATLLQKQNQGQGGQQGNPYLSKLKALQYLSGNDASEMFETLMGQGISPIVQAIQERDQVITGLYKMVQNLQQQFQTYGSTQQQGAFEGRIAGWVKELGLPEEAVPLAKEIYLAYEGDDLDEQFPEILRNRWDSTVALVNKLNQSKVAAARASSSPFKLPGKGGSGTPGQPIGLKGNESAKDTAEYLWNALQGSKD